MENTIPENTVPENAAEQPSTQKASVEKTIRNLQRRGFSVKHFITGEEAAQYLVQEIQDTTVGFGGSITAKQLNLYDLLAEKNECTWHWRPQTATDGAQYVTDADILGKANSAKVYITSANAIAETGEIINIDGRGNRLAGQVFGIGKKVYIISGTNKIAPDFNGAVTRARQIAAVTRAKDFPYNTPCKIDGKCHDCRSKERVCNAMLVLWSPLFDMELMEVVLIDEELGY